MKMTGPLRTLAVLGLVLVDVVLNVFVFHADILLLVISTLATAVAIAMVLLLDDNAFYQPTTAELVTDFAAKHAGHKGQALRFPEIWKKPENLVPGELTCVGVTDIVTNNTNVSCFLLGLDHHSNMNATFIYVIWRSNDDTYNAVAVSATGSSLMRRADNVNLQSVTPVRFFGTIYGKPDCPYTKRKL